MELTRIPPAVVAGGAAAAQYAIVRNRPMTPVSLFGAGTLLAAAGWLGLGSLREFFRSRTSIDPHNVDHASALITTGPNGVSRNPMYLALAGVLAAHATARRSATALLLVVGFVAYLDRWQVPAEEGALTSIFGTAYEHYRSTTPRWIGWTAR